MAISLKASERGLELVDKARKKKGWNKDDQAWHEAAKTSKATLKRFWAGYPVRKENFEKICETVGEDWQKIADSSDADTEFPN